MILGWLIVFLELSWYTPIWEPGSVKIDRSTLGFCLTLFWTKIAEIAFVMYTILAAISSFIANTMEFLSLLSGINMLWLFFKRFWKKRSSTQKSIFSVAILFFRCSKTSGFYYRFPTVRTVISVYLCTPSL